MKPSHYKRTVLFVLTLTMLFIAPANAENYDSLLSSMQARQGQLDQELRNRSQCLGERLDGLLQINASCSVEAERFAEEENRDREVLHQLMAQGLNKTPAEVGVDRAQLYQERYVEGVLRQIRLPDNGELTWWDGVPPDPRISPVTRILALRAARIYEEPSVDSTVKRDNIQQYEAFGVVDSTKDQNGTLWYQVTDTYVPKLKPSNWNPERLGWVSEDHAIPWRRALAMKFTGGYERRDLNSSLFFNKPENILRLTGLPRDERKSTLDTIRQDIQGVQAKENGVLAIEPLTGSSSIATESFEAEATAVMYPVLDYHSRLSKDELNIDGMFTRLLEVAARTRPDGAGSYSGEAPPIDLVFVMDTTHSMKDYFQTVLSSVEEFARKNKGDAIKFGLVAYQDRGEKFDFTIKEYTKNVQSATDFFSTLQKIQVRARKVAGDDIPESVLEGVDKALESSQWRDNTVKIIFLVGDAPGREDNTTVQRLRNKALNQDINIFAFPILGTKVSGVKGCGKSGSKGCDAVTKEQYAELSLTYRGAQGKSETITSIHEIRADATDFQQKISDSFTTAQNDFRKLEQCAALNSCNALPESEPGSLSYLIFQQASLLMADKRLPEQEIQGWVADNVLSDPSTPALKPMILLTKAELERLLNHVRELRDLGERALQGEGGTTLNFFDLVSRNTRWTMVDPTAVQFEDAFSIPLGINELPYDSDIMATTRDEFENPSRVRNFFEKMEHKVGVYRDLLNNDSKWKKLNARADDRDKVVALDLDFLP